MENYVGEIRLFAGSYAPAGWLFCHGQTLRIPEYQILFTLIGTQWGGDGKSTFNLPDLRGRVVVGSGEGPGLTSRSIGQTGGDVEVKLLQHAMPGHTHALMVSTKPAESKVPTSAFFAKTASPTAPAGNEGLAYATAVGSDRPLAPETIVPTGSSAPHENRMPSFAINYIIATRGTYPSD